jgi:hypothetical protein
MKFQFFVLLFLTVLLNNTFSQITIADEDGYDLTNITAFLPASPEKVNFYISNQGATDITFVVQIVSYKIPSDAVGYLVCACGNCVPVILQDTPFSIGEPTVLAAGATYSGVCDVEYLSSGSTAQANITIDVYEQGNESNHAQFTLDTEYTSISDIRFANMLSVTPNPATEWFTISINQSLPGSQLVFSDILGKTVFKMNVGDESIQFNTNQFTQGVYFVSLINGSRILMTKKLVVNRL